MLVVTRKDRLQGLTWYKHASLGEEPSDDCSNGHKPKGLWWVKPRENHKREVIQFTLQHKTADTWQHNELCRYWNYSVRVPRKYTYNSFLVNKCMDLYLYTISNIILHEQYASSANSMQRIWTCSRFIKLYKWIFLI